MKSADFIEDNHSGTFQMVALRPSESSLRKYTLYLCPAMRETSPYVQIPIEAYKIAAQTRHGPVVLPEAVFLSRREVRRGDAGGRPEG